MLRLSGESSGDFAGKGIIVLGADPGGFRLNGAGNRLITFGEVSALIELLCFGPGILLGVLVFETGLDIRAYFS